MGARCLALLLIVATALASAAFAAKAFAVSPACSGSGSIKVPSCDSDRDGLKNGLERSLGTSLRRKDSDNDGLKDGLEVKTFGTDPLDSDSDDDGTVDGNDDSDGDGTSDEDEDDRSGEGSTKEDLDDGDGLQPTPTPTPSGNFDANNNTTAAGNALFEIPGSFTGNISRGSSQWSAKCSGCHSSEKTNKTFTELQNALSLQQMQSITVSEQELADLTAYLSRSRR